MNSGKTSRNIRLSEIFRMVFSRQSDPRISSHLAKGAMGSFALKIASTGLSFLSGLLLARFMGARQFGAYSYVMTIIGLLATHSVMGMDRLIVREVAANHARSEWSFMHGLIRWSNRIACTLSAFIIFIALVITVMFPERFDPTVLPAFRIALVILPVVTLTRLRQTILRGLRRIIAGQFPEMILQPALLIVLISLFFIVSDQRIEASLAVTLYAVAAIVSLLIGMRLLSRSLPEAVRKAKPLYRKDEWLRTVLPLFFLGVLQAVQNSVDIIMIEAMKGTTAVGVYSVASRCAGLITFGIVAVNTAMGPTITNLFVAKDMARMQETVTKSARLVLLFSVPVTIALIFLSRWVMLIFGHDFAQGATTLTILSIGQFMNSSLGSVGILLIMTGHERDASVGLGISLALNVALNAVLIPVWGIEGAAASKAVSITAWNFILAVFVRRRLGIYSTAIGTFKI